MDPLNASLPASSQKSSQVPIPAITAELRVIATKLTANCGIILNDLSRAAAEVSEVDRPRISKAVDELATRCHRLHLNYEVKAVSESLKMLLEETVKISSLPISLEWRLKIIIDTGDLTIYNARLSELLASTTAHQMPLAEPTIAMGAAPISAELQTYATELTTRCNLICTDLLRAEAEVSETDMPHAFSMAANELATRCVVLHMEYEVETMIGCLDGLLKEVGKTILLQIPVKLKLDIMSLTAYMAAFSTRLNELLASTTAQQMPLAEPTIAMGAALTSAAFVGALSTPVEPPPNAAVDHCGRFIDLQYRLWYAHKEFGQSDSPEEITVLSNHRLNELLEYANTKFAEPDPEPEPLPEPLPEPMQERMPKPYAGLFIQGEFLSLFRLQKPQLHNKTCSLYVRKCYVDYRKILMDTAEDYQATGQEFACRLTGNPGIGKSTFLVYHLLKLLKEANQNEHAVDSGEGSKDDSKKEQAHRNDLAGDIPTGDKSKHEKALRLKIFLTDGRCFYIYSRRTGWIQAKKENVWIDMHKNRTHSPDTWLLVDSYDVPETTSRNTLSVSSPNIRNYIKFEKNNPIVYALPTWSLEEVERLFNELLNAAMNDLTLPGDVRNDARNGRLLMSQISTSTLSEEENADDTSEIAEFFAEAAGSDLYLDIVRLRKRFNIWGGILRKLFSLTPLSGLKSLFKRKKAAKLWKQFTRGDFSLFDSATVEDAQVNIQRTNVLHEIFQPVHDQRYLVCPGHYTCITVRGSSALEEWLLSSDWKELMAKYIEGSNSGSAGDLFESFVHSFFTCRTGDRSLYWRDCGNGPSKFVGALWLDLPKVSERVLSALSDAREPVEKRSKLLYIKPPSPFFKGLQSIFFPGIVVQITISPMRTPDQFATLCDQLLELLKLWGLPEGKKYMVAYVVPGTKFKKFYQTRGPFVYCRPHAEFQLACVHCCEEWFDFKVFGMPLPGATWKEVEKFKLKADERWTLNLNGELVRKV